MNNLITEKERKELQLEILDEVHDFCINNGLRYSLAYGTLLGAIRHKGFIPWDDDMDIMMPYQDMMKLKEMLKSDNISYIDATICKDFLWFFSRISSNKTFSRVAPFIKRYGVNIDLYPFVNINDGCVSDFLDKGLELRNVLNKKIALWSFFSRFFPLKTFPGLRKATKDLRDHVFKDAEQATNTFFSTGGSFKYFNVFTKNIFEDVNLIKFENRQYFAIKNYDYFLSQVYGDYMKLPPEEQRQPYHHGQFYWKDEH